MSRTLRDMAAALALVLLCALAPAMAGEEGLTVGVHTWSAHEPRGEYSNDNPGAYVRHGGWQVGAYRNSLRRPTVYVAAEVFGLGQVSVAVGAATGYRGERRTVSCESVASDLRMSIGTARQHDADGSMHCWRQTSSWRHALAPLITASVALPPVAGLTPRLTYLPRLGAFGAHTLHLSLEARL
jgi:hypothetical protein